MAKRKKIHNRKIGPKIDRASKIIVLPHETQRWLWFLSFFLISSIIVLSFFDLSGGAGRILIKIGTFSIGKVIFVTPIILVAIAFVILKTQKRYFLSSVVFSLFLAILGLTGILGSIGIYRNLPPDEMGGVIGYYIAWLPMSFFDIWVSLILFSFFTILAFIASLQLVKDYLPSISKSIKQQDALNLSQNVVRKIVAPKFKVKELSPPIETSDNVLLEKVKPEPKPKERPKDVLPLKPQGGLKSYQLPPIDLLDQDRDRADSGDIKIYSAIIKRTLENFGIPVEVSEINVGPTVTQYAVKPAEGIKLSRIVQLSNDLALALAAHPIRIEAPIPGKPLVGIEVPNKTRAQVRLRNLLENPAFQNSRSNLTLALGRDVSGNPIFADLARMPHLLVAGATGTGKTICLNTIILSLLYQNSPDILRFILVDPKRVEFPIYNDLPHLLTPVIYDAQKTVNALKWLIGEMERRFDVLSSVKTRDIFGYNQLMIRSNKELMPYLVLIIDELADLMAARGREMEAGIVRLAQMARAVGIHLIVATQRPSVEVITGLIKANITSRIAFQVASQVDSRTVLDMAGAEKLLGLGDMLFVSAEISKPKRIQGAFVSEKEIQRVVDFVKKHTEQVPGQEESLNLELEKSLDQNLSSDIFLEGEEDPLYEEAKRLVIKTRRASASFLQRRLRLGYARAARLMDMLEERGVVSPGEGAKPRQVLIGLDQEEKEKEDEEWTPT